MCVIMQKGRVNMHLHRKRFFFECSKTKSYYEFGNSAKVRWRFNSTSAGKFRVHEDLPFRRYGPRFVARLPPAVVRMDHERLPRRCKYCDTIIDDVTWPEYGILSIASPLSATLFWPN
jgi:hypothetical protein